MNLAIPPSLFYAIGAILVLFGALRAYSLGWKRRPAPPAPGEEAESADVDEVPAWDRGRGGGYKRHITFGLLWVGLGLFLIVKTILDTRGG